MNKLFGHLVQQFRQFYKNLTPVKRLSVMAASVVAVVGLAVISMMLTGTSHTALFTNVAAVPRF
jgi:flagellar M-ring protein FliF